SVKVNAVADFADRDAVLSAILAWINGQFHVGPLSPNVEAIAEVQEQVMKDFDANRAINRAMVISRFSQETPWSGRQDRLNMWRTLLDEVTSHLEPEERLLGQAAIVYLTGGLPWLMMADESGLDGDQAGRAAGWAIRTLIADLRTRNDEARRTGAAPRPSRQKERSS
ncbi:MAG TPA: hypothetical protein VGS21_00145, partial [Acidimicrobiales bacterium]|nr:hypothetical protein [Acidimicrobiales bacterium]